MQGERKTTRLTIGWPCAAFNRINGSINIATEYRLWSNQIAIENLSSENTKHALEV